MQKELKRFGERVTALFSERFFRSRFSLACMYTFMLAVMLLLSTSIARSVFFDRLERRFEPFRSRMMVERVLIVEPPSANDVKADFMKTLLIVNGILLLFGAVMSYLLAGATLTPLKEAYERQRRFLSDASHELRTPLAILQTGLENDALRASTTERKNEIQSHLEEVERMGKLVNDLLTLSRFDEGTGSYPVERFDLALLLKSLAERFTAFAEERKVTLSLGAIEPAIILAHEETLSRGLQNILKNAILYNKEGGNVTLSLQVKDRRAILTIIDTGIGMNKESLLHIFDRFYRADESRTRSSGGSGLGLSIARSAIREAKGDIRITSIPDVGTEVVITLPIHIAS